MFWLLLLPRDLVTVVAIMAFLAGAGCGVVATSFATLFLHRTSQPQAASPDAGLAVERKLQEAEVRLNSMRAAR